VVFNSKQDLEAVKGTAEYDAFMQILTGSIYRLEIDHELQQNRWVTDTSTIERFGFTLADFNSTTPQLPEYVAPEVVHVTTISKLALIEELEKRGQLESLMDMLNIDPMLKFKWDAAASLEITHELMVAASKKLGYTAEQMQEVFDATARLI